MIDPRVGTPGAASGTESPVLVTSRSPISDSAQIPTPDGKDPAVENEAGKITWPTESIEGAQ